MRNASQPPFASATLHTLYRVDRMMARACRSTVQNACEQAEMSELAGLKYAELEYNFERQHKAVLRRMSVYIVASQIFSAMMITAFLALLRWGT